MGRSRHFRNHRIQLTDLRPADHTARKRRPDDAFVNEGLILTKQSAGEPLGQDAAGSSTAWGAIDLAFRKDRHISQVRARLLWRSGKDRPVDASKTGFE